MIESRKDLDGSFSYDDAYVATLEYFDGDDLATDCFLRKYALRDRDGNLLERTPEDMHRRLAREFARIEKKYPNPLSEEEIFGLLDRFKYVIPQGSPMAGIGNDKQVQSLSNCFVLPHKLQDSYASIMMTDQQQVQIMKRRGGVGFDISNLRPRGLPTANAAYTTDGIEVFMERFSRSCREVAQGGRRGALMLTISCHSPSVRRFASVKNEINPNTGERDKVTGANVSIRLTDEFMRAVECDQRVQLRFPVDRDAEHKMEEWVNARELWDEIVRNARESAEPGLLFWDTIIKTSPADCYSDVSYGTESTNPCSELPLSAGDSCRLCALNLLSFVNDPFAGSARFDFELFGNIAMKSQRLMDDLVDLESESIDRIIAKIESDPEDAETKQVELKMWQDIKGATLGGRRTGLGITALGDTIAALGMKYGSDESIELVEEIYKKLETSAYKSSCIMAGERGAFPVFDAKKERDHAFIQRVISADDELKKLYKKNGRRNIALTTTAPTGTVSILTQTTSGIEPVVFLRYTRRRKVPADSEKIDFVDSSGDAWQEYEVMHHGLKRWIQATGESDITKSPYHDATANDLDWQQRVKLQAAAQKWVCHGISSTINLPEDVSIDTVKDIYFQGWKQGLKGITIYREGSRSGVLIRNKFKQHDPPARPKELPCNIHHATIKGEAWTILVGLMEGKPYEVFGGLSSMVEVPKKHKEGILIKHPRKTTPSVYDLVVGEGDEQFKIKDVVRVFDNPTEGSLTRTISLALRTGAPVQTVSEQLLKDNKDSDMFSFSRVMSRVLKQYIPDGTRSHLEKVCSECGSDQLAYIEGCVTCAGCGNSRCS